MKKRLIAMILAGTMIFGQNVYATELPNGDSVAETEQETTEQENNQQDSSQIDEIQPSDENADNTSSDSPDEYESEEEKAYWEDIQQYATSDDESGEFDEEVYKSNINAKKRTLYVGNPILVAPSNIYVNMDNFHITVSDESVCRVSIEPCNNDYDYGFFKIEPLKRGKISFDVTDMEGKKVYNCEVTVLDDLPEDAAPINDIEIRSWFFNRTYYGADGYISKDEISHIKYLSFDYGCNKCNITDLSGLEYATGLQYLSIVDTNVKDISPIMGLNNLEKLSISGENFKDYSWLGSFSKLIDLGLTKTSIRDFSFISKLANLERLYLYSDEKFTDLSVVENLSNLQVLDVSNTNISDLKPLSKLKNLQDINMNGCNQIKNIEPLYNLSKLRRLQINNDQINDEQKLGMIRSWIENNTYSKGDLIEIPLYINFLAWKEKIHIDACEGDVNSIEIQQNDSNCVKILAKDKGNIKLSISLGNNNIKTLMTIQGENEDKICGADSDKDVVSYNNVNGISQTILTNNGELWGLYPKVKRIHTNVKKYVSKWIYTIDEDSNEVVDYILDNNDDLWSGDKKIQSNIQDVNGHYALTNNNTLIDLYNNKSDAVENVEAWNEADEDTIIYKADGSVWFRKEVGKDRIPDEWKKLDDDVVQFDGHSYLTKSGEIVYVYISSNGDYTCKVDATGVADVDWDNGFYYGQDGNTYIDCWNTAINIGRIKISKWGECNHGNDTVYYVLTDDSKLFYFTKDDINNKQFIADNVTDLQSYVYDEERGYSVIRPWIKTQSGEYFYLNNGMLSKTEDFNNSSDRTYKRNGITILTKVKKIWRIDEPKMVYALRTDGTIWDVTGVPKQILDLGQSTVKPGDVDGDSKVSTKDLMIVLYGVSGRNTLTDEQALAADIDGDGKVTVSDLTKILYYVSGRTAVLYEEERGRCI